MDTYLARAYNSDATSINSVNQSDYPFWDYRSRRRDSGSCFLDDEVDVSTLNLSQQMSSYLSSSHPESGSTSSESCCVTLHLVDDSTNGVSLSELYQRMLSFIDPDLKLFRVTERALSAKTQPSGGDQSETSSCGVPTLAVILFVKDGGNLKHDGVENRDRLRECQDILLQPPWRFHHSDKLNHGKINTEPFSSQDFYSTSDQLPLWAVRQVHYGREHIRYVLYVPHTSWSDQVHFYQLLLGLAPTLERPDFCLFTLCALETYDIQFALKRLETPSTILPLPSVHLHVQVTDLGRLVPLFPHVCRPINDVKWQTTDHDGNVIVLDVHPHKVSQVKRCSATSPLNVQCADLDSSDTSLLSKPLPSKFHRSSPCNHNSSSITSHLSLNLDCLQTQPFRNKLEPFIFSDTEDLGIDLPSPPLRCRSRKQEDTTSLSPTCSSEESGVHLQHSSEDGSFSEEDSLRSCLSKSSSLKIRHVKFKVRFKEEVEAFEDSSSHLSSSGFESEDQSDAEVETRFPYIPSYGDQSASHGETTEQLLSAGLIGSYNKSKYQKSSSIFASSSVSSMLSQNKNCVSENMKSGEEVTTDFKVTNKSTHALVETSSPPSSIHQLHRPAHTKSDSTRFLSPKESLGKTFSSSVSVPTDTQSCYCPTGVQEQPHNVLTTSILNKFGLARKQTPAFSQSLGEIPASKLSQNTQLNGQISTSKIIPKGETGRTKHTPKSSTDNLFVAESRSSDPDSNSPARTAPFPPLQHFQDGEHSYWFTDPKLDVTRVHARPPGNKPDTALKFTLKFDTCPTSGLSPGQEQIGFYV